jgi:membrane associated rhomboid family serine protease/Zn-finger nucleic acid-binding protein
MPDATIACPVCNSVSLVKRIKFGVELDVCPNCRGIWLDKGELAPFLEKAIEGDTNIPEDRTVLDKRPTRNMSDLKEASRLCPSGHGAMNKHVYGYDSGVLFDQCAVCGGIWTDKKEAWNMASYLKSNPTVKELSKAMAMALDERENVRMLGAASKDLSNRTGLLGLLPKLFFPLRDDTVTRRIPLISLILMVVSIAVTIAARWGVKDGLLIRELALVPNQLKWHQLFTATFLHAGVFHLIGNLYLLWVFADNVEDKLGRVNFIVFFLLGGALGWLAYALLNPNSAVPALGLGPALAAIVGSYFVFFPHAKLSVGGTIKAIPMTAWIVIVVWMLVSGGYWTLYRNDAVVAVPILAEAVALFAGVGAAWLVRTRRIALSGSEALLGE